MRNNNNTTAGPQVKPLTGMAAKPASGFPGAYHSGNPAAVPYGASTAGMPSPYMPAGVASSGIPSSFMNGMPMSPGSMMGGNISPTVPIQQESYIENILRMNLGKMATIYMTFENNKEWNAKIFKGRIEAAGRDHIIISDPQTGMRYLLLMVYLDYITFDEELNYQYPYAALY